MTLRKPTYSGGVKGTIALPYPATPTSPTESTPQSPGIEPSSSKATFIPNDNELQGHVHSPRGLSPEGLTADQSPRIVEEDGGRSDSQTESYSNILPPSLQISQPLVTPSSSLESQHSIPAGSPGIIERNLGDPPQGQSRARSSSTNPFLRNLEKDFLPTTNLVNESSSVDIWADEQTAIDANTHREQHLGAPPSSS